jgi:amino acid transporter
MARAKDEEQLRQLGYTASFERSMGLWENFSLGFTYLSPVVGVYTLFAVSLAAGGPPMFWSYILVGCGQLLVCLVFCEIVSQYPIAGGIYPWAQRLVGPRWAWTTGWVYLWALWTTIAGVAVGAAPYLATLIGYSSASTGMTTIVAALLVVVTTALNLSGTKALGRLALLGFSAELLGALVVGGYLLLFERKQSFGILFDTFGINENGSYLPAFLAASLAGIFQYYGFEACADVAEEVPDPTRRIPRAMRMTIYIGGAAATFVCLAFLLAIPDISKVISGEDKDPISSVLNATFGPVGSRLVLAIVLISFLSCVLSLQAAASRLLFAFGRDEVVILHRWLQEISPTSRIPANALVTCGVIPLSVVVCGYFLQDALTTVISFAAIGIYLAFQMIVAGALYARVRGWRPEGPFSLGRWGAPVTVLALAYGIAAIVNIAWPRAPDASWFENYAMVLTTSVILFIGLLFSVAVHRRQQAAGERNAISQHKQGVSGSL